MTRKEEIKQASEEVLGTVEYQCGFADGARWADETMIDKACLWLSLNADVFGFFKKMKLQEMVNEFAKAMKGGEE